MKCNQYNHCSRPVHVSNINTLMECLSCRDKNIFGPRILFSNKSIKCQWCVWTWRWFQTLNRLLIFAQDQSRYRIEKENKSLNFPDDQNIKKMLFDTNNTANCSQKLYTRPIRIFWKKYYCTIRGSNHRQFSFVYSKEQLTLHIESLF